MSVYEPAKIKETSVDDYDAIVIAVESHQTAQVMRENLLSFGVPASKIIHSIKYYDDITTFESVTIQVPGHE